MRILKGPNLAIVDKVVILNGTELCCFDLSVIGPWYTGPMIKSIEVSLLLVNSDSELAQHIASPLF